MQSSYKLSPADRKEVFDLVSGAYDDDDGGRNPEERDWHRQMIRELAKWAELPHPVFQHMTMEDLRALDMVLTALHRIRYEYLCTRLRQSQSRTGSIIPSRKG